MSPRKKNTADPRFNLIFTNNQSFTLSSVVSPIASLYSEPRARISKDTELLFGHNFSLFNEVLCSLLFCLPCWLVLYRPRISQSICKISENGHCTCVF